MISQALLEKFEFFPVKCRIQRASEMYMKSLERQSMYTGNPLKTKVLISTLSIFIIEQRKFI
jgi:hypothetical protein